MKIFFVAMVGAFFLMAAGNHLFAQSEVSGWGNLRGIRVGDQLVAFTTAVGVFNTDFTQATLSQREGPIHTNQYLRDGNTVTVGENLQYSANGGRGGAGRAGAAGAAGAAAPSTRPGSPVSTSPPGSAATTTPGNVATTMPANPPPARGGRGGRGPAPTGFNYTLSYTDSAPGVCDVKIQLTSIAAQSIGGVYYFVNLPSADFADGSAQLIGAATNNSVALNTPNEQGKFLTGSATGIRVTGKDNQTVQIDFPAPLDVVVQRSRGRDNGDIQIYFPLIVGNTTAGQTASATFTIRASRDVDTTPVTITVDPAKTGRTWLGMGGNYRIQNQRLDPLHIQFIMDNMRVAYGRVAMPWNSWQPDENSPPPPLAGATTAPANGRGGNGGGNGGGAMNSIASAMDIAHKLSQQKIPMIISVWSPPGWAVLPNANAGGRGGGGSGGGQRLDPAKYDQIAKSIGSYLVYLRDHYGTEPELFSFNESNIGINVRQTPEDHAAAIKILGAYFKSIGLKTRMLLGDTGDAPPINFIQSALNDPQAVQFIGAVSFHSWRGATDAQYQKWADAATKLGVPLIDAEGGNDAQASSYPNIFREPWYALDEAAEYVRIMRICQPAAILEWQLTENYSVLSTDRAGQLHPTQRFFNLKQFNLAPAGSVWMDANSSNGLVLSAAFVETDKGIYTIHLVNNGAARPITITGLPATLTTLNLYITDATRGMAKQDSVKVENGTAHFNLQGLTLTTLTNSEQ